MRRLIDDIRAGALRAPRFVGSRCEAWQKVTKQLRPMLDNPELMVIPIDHVLSYFYEGNDKERWDIFDDFPNLTPLMPQFWAEGRMPKRIVSREKGVTDVASLVPHGREGFLVNALDPKNVKGEGIPENARWILWFELFIDYGCNRLEGPHGSIFLAVDAQGHAIEVPMMQSYAGPEHADLMKDFLAWINPVLLAICWVNAKIEV